MTDERASAPSVPPARERIAVVVNGNAKSVTADVISTLDQILLGGDLFVSRRLEDASEIARTLVNRGYGTVLTGGGDGTFTVMVTEVVREARAQDKPVPRFGLLKLGTGNALAWVAGASRAKGRGLSADIQRLREDAGSRPLRLVEVEGFLAPFAGFGVDAVVLKDYADVKAMLSRTPLKRFAAGALGYTLASVTRSLPTFVVRPVPHCRVRNEGAEAYRIGEKGGLVGQPIPKGETIYEGPARIVGLATIPYYGFGFRMFPFADERPDRMQLRVSTVSSLGFVRNFPAIWRGEYHDPNIVFDYLVDAVSIEMDPPTVFQIGGDPQGERARVAARVSREPIRLVDFYAPPSAS
ncbi:MAG: hypothetical protein AMXMBFR56_12380 [Polyangiaceae bacterium]